MIKRSIQQEDITLVNICAPNVGAPKHIKQILTDIKGESDSNTVIVGEFNTPVTSRVRSSKQETNKETKTLNDILDKMNLVDIFRTFHPKAAECTFFFKCTWNISTTDHMSGHKTQINKFKNEIIPSIFSDHKGMKLEINCKKKKNPQT
uniref:Endonuclease/exonuclease/phosphatase domain-containing protein n=1 Tax=Rousettus aegyptiacus TaxID=9407 RepID=A0A7J8KB17_ROUAE|nr:hypothetical protein HJG63_007906 [Rousettus aegyptiacus]